MTFFFVYNTDNISTVQKKVANIISVTVMNMSLRQKFNVCVWGGGGGGGGGRRSIVILWGDFELVLLVALMLKDF